MLSYFLCYVDEGGSGVGDAYKKTNFVDWSLFSFIRDIYNSQTTMKREYRNYSRNANIGMEKLDVKARVERHI